MKEKTQQISEEEYEQIKQELEEILEIQEELKLAVEEQKYKSHVPLAGNFGELLINLMRSNHEIDKEIDLAIKNFLKSLQTKKEIKEKLSVIINYQREILEAKKELETTETPAELTSIAAHYPEFQTVYITIQDGISKKNANNFLITQVETLQERFETLQVQKMEYEKQRKEKNKQTPKILK